MIMGSMHPVQVIAVTGGKGGVGKTNVSVNLSIALAEMGRRVMLMDADLGLANIDVLLGLPTGPNLAHVIDGRCSLEEAISSSMPACSSPTPATSSRANDGSPACSAIAPQQPCSFGMTTFRRARLSRVIQKERALLVMSKSRS